MRNLILIGAIVGVVLILRYYLQHNPKQFGRLMQQFGLALIVVVILGLLVTGRLNWVLALPAAALVIFNRLQPLLRHLPLLHGLYRRSQSQHTQQTTGKGRQSSVTARYVHMTLDLDSGEMEGKVLRGKYEDYQLSQLSLTQLIELLNGWQDDEDSTELLRAYLDRCHPNWQTQAGAGSAGYHGSSGQATSHGGMSAEEARQVLGVTESATEEDIITSHRRLMQKLHPDRGGSTYLAAKINQAKDVLLDIVKT